MALDKIVIRGARQNNLKNIDLEIPRDKLIVFTGLSGSGKTSLAFDTIYADGQRRYVESLSSYARMFLGQAEKPDVDEISGLSPAISIDQKTTSKNPRSTVGTVTEIYDYLRLLYARVGIPHCPICGREITQQTVDQMVDKVLALPEGTRIQVMAPIVRQRKGTYQKELDAARRSGYVRARVDGNMYELTEEIKLEKNYKHTIEIVVDRLSVKPEIRSRLADSIETCCAMTGGLALVDVVGGEEMLFSQNYACPDHDISIEELSKLTNRSLTSFKKEFRRHFQMPPHKWYIRQRLMHSRLLLISTSKSISEIGNACTFPNTSHFIKLFKKEYQMTPAAYRNRHITSIAPEKQPETVQNAEIREAL